MFSALVLILHPSVSIAAADAVIEELQVTGLRTPSPKQDFIGSFSALNEEQLTLTSANHIQQYLDQIAGVNFHRNNGVETLPAIRSPVLTGSGACGSVLTAEDGIPLRPAGFCNVNELFEANWQQAQRIEVIRGPSSALYGSNALHGVVNVILPNPGEPQRRITLEANTQDMYRAELIAANDNWLLLANGTNDQGWRDNSGVDEQKLTLKNLSSLGNVSIESGLTHVNLNQETAGFVVGADSYKNRALTQANANPEAFRDANATRLWVKIVDQQNHWQITPYARHSEMQFLQHFLPGTPLEENSQTSAGVQSQWLWNGQSTQWIIGLDGELTNGWLQQTQAEPTQGSAFLQATIPQGKQYDYRVQATQIAPFVHLQQSITEQITLSAGLRYEWMQYDYDNRMLTGRTRDDGSECGFGGCRYSRPADDINTFDNLSPSLGLSYQLAPSQKVYLAAARGFRAPQTSELYRLQREQQVADIDSEQLDSIEFGYRGKLHTAEIEAVLYTMHKRNVIYRNSNAQTLDSGATDHRGLELTMEYRFADNWRISGSASIARHTYDFNDAESGIERGNEVDTAPKHFGQLSLHWQPSHELHISSQWQHMGSYYADTANQHRYRGHDLLNLFANWRITPGLSLTGQISNLTNRRYAERADYTSFSGDRYLPGADRATQLAISYAW